MDMVVRSGLPRILELSPVTFRQNVRRILKPGASVWPGRKLHTLNRCGNLEVIDGSRIQPKSAFLRRPVSTTSPAGMSPAVSR